MSPAVLTETVWALAQEKPAVIPDRVIVLTTAAGASSAAQRPIWASTRLPSAQPVRTYDHRTVQPVRHEPPSGRSRAEG